MLHNLIINIMYFLNRTNILHAGSENVTRFVTKWMRDVGNQVMGSKTYFIQVLVVVTILWTDIRKFVLSKWENIVLDSFLSNWSQELLTNERLIVMVWLLYSEEIITGGDKLWLNYLWTLKKIQIYLKAWFFEAKFYFAYIFCKNSR